MTTHNSSNQKLSKEDELFLGYLDDVRSTLLDSLQDSVFGQAVQLHELTDVSSRELRKAFDSALDRFRQYLKPAPQTRADKEASIWRLENS